MAKKGRKPSRSSNRSSEGSVSSRVDTPKPEPQGEPRQQTDMVTSPDTIPYPKQLFLQASSSSPIAVSYASEETVPVPREQRKPFLDTTQSGSAQIVIYQVLEGSTSVENPHKHIKGMKGEPQKWCWAPLGPLINAIQDGRSSNCTAEFVVDCTEGHNLRLFLDTLRQRYAGEDCEVYIMILADTMGPNADIWSIPQFPELNQGYSWSQTKQLRESLSKWLNLEINVGDLEQCSVEHSAGMSRWTYGYKLSKAMYVNQPSLGTEQPVSTESTGVCASSTGQPNTVEEDEKPPFYNHIVGLILSDMSHQDLPFGVTGNRSQRILYSHPTTGHEFCWVSVAELIRAVSTDFGGMEVRASHKRHSALPLVDYGSIKANEAHYALPTLVRYQTELDQQRHSSPVNGQDDTRPLLVLMRRIKGFTTWSLLNEECKLSERSPSRRRAFVRSARFELPFEGMRFEDVYEAEVIRLPNARIDTFEYWMDEEASAEWFQKHGPEEGEHTSHGSPEVNAVPNSPLNGFDASIQCSYGEPRLINDLSERIETMEESHCIELVHLKEIHCEEQRKLQAELDKARVGYETLHALITKLTAAIPPPTISSANRPVVMELTSSLLYEDDMLPHKYSNPHLSLQEEQFVWQYAYAMIQREPSRYSLADHQLLVRQVADLCVQAMQMHDPSRCHEARPNPGKAVLHGMKSLPKCLAPEQPEPGICARCGRTSKVRFAYPSVTGTLTDLATAFQELCNVPFCRKCTDTEQLHKSNPGVENANLYLQQDRYVQMPIGITGVDTVKPAPQYSSFENCPAPGRTMKFGVLTLTLEYAVKTESKPDPLESNLTSPPGVIPLASRHTPTGNVPSSVQSTPVAAVEPVAHTPSHMSIHGSDIEERPRVTPSDFATKVSWKDGTDILKHANDKAQKFVWMPASKSSRTSVEEFAQCVRSVQTLLTNDTRVVAWLSEAATRKRASLVDILAEIVQVVAGTAHKFNIADRSDLKECLGHTPKGEPLTLDRAMYNFMSLFRMECLQMEQCTKYVKNTMYTPQYRTFKRTEEHFRRAAPLSKIIHEQFGLCQPIPEDDQSLMEYIFKALPEATQDGVTDKLRNRASSSHDISLANMSLQYLREVCYVLEDGRSSRSPSPYHGRANVMTPSFEGGEEELCEQCEDDNSTASLHYSNYNRAQSTRAPPRSFSRSRSTRGNSVVRGRSMGRRNLSPHPSKTSRLKSAVLDAIVAFDPTKSNAADICANCGHAGHTAKRCTEAYDADRVRKNIQLYVEHKTRNIDAPKGQVHAMCSAMAAEMFHQQCGTPSPSSAEDTDAEATDPEDSASDNGEEEEEERSNDSKRSPTNKH